MGVTETDENAETTGIEEVEVEFDKIIEMAGEEGDAEMAEEACGQGADAEGLGDEAADNGAASKGPATWNSQDKSGDVDVDHTRQPEEPSTMTYEDRQELEVPVSTEAHNDEEAASKAQPQPLLKLDMIRC